MNAGWLPTFRTKITWWSLRMKMSILKLFQCWTLMSDPLGWGMLEDVCRQEFRPVLCMLSQPGELVIELGWKLWVRQKQLQKRLVVACRVDNQLLLRLFPSLRRQEGWHPRPLVRMCPPELAACLLGQQFGLQRRQQVDTSLVQWFQGWLRQQLLVQRLSTLAMVSMFFASALIVQALKHSTQNLVRVTLG